MPPRELSAGALDPDALSAPTSSSVTEADELARAQARAEAARARATRLRRQADAASSERGTLADAAEADVEPDAGVPLDGEQSDAAPSRRRRLPRLSRLPRVTWKVAAAVTAAVAVICAALAATGYVAWQHRGIEKERQRSAEYAAAARNGVLTMMSLDPSTARDDMQRFADDTTGLFKVGILMGAEDAIKALEKSKVTAKGTVKDVAVESMTKDSAVVLVAARAEYTKPGQAKPDTQSVRLVVTVQNEQGQLKISRIEFVP